MTEGSSLTEADRANLVAYLDGELDEATSRVLEAKIRSDPAAREEVETLRRTWEMLDFLQRPEPSPSFTNRTLEMVQPARPHARSTMQFRQRRWAFPAFWAAALLLVGVGGFFAGAGFGTSRSGDADLVRDLRIIENYSLYEPIENLDFLRELDCPELFGDTPQKP